MFYVLFVGFQQVNYCIVQRKNPNRKNLEFYIFVFWKHLHMKLMLPYVQKTK